MSVFIFVMHTDQKGYDYFMACRFNESFDKPGLFYPHLKLTLGNFFCLKSRSALKTCYSGTNPYFYVVYVSSQIWT